MKTAVIILLLAVPAALAQYEKTEAMVPMRDGIKLHTVLFAPKDQNTPLPILFVRTPYGAVHEEKALLSQYPELTSEGYIFAFQDIRGRFTSEGQFVMQRRPRDKKDAKAIDESTEAYDSAEWLVRNAGGTHTVGGILGSAYGRPLPNTA